VCEKQCPDIFKEAARRLGLPCVRCLGIEDAISGVTSAKAAGCRSLGLTTSFPADQLAASGADWTAAKLEEALPEVLMW